MHEDLLEIVKGAKDDELPGLIGKIEEAKVVANLRLMRVASQQDRFFTLAEVAGRWSLKVARVREMARRGEIPTVKTGERGYRVRGSDLVAIERNGGIR